MPSLKNFDLLVGAALERLIEAMDELKGTEGTGKSLAMRIGRIVAALWDVRSDLYKIAPELKPDFVVEYESNKGRYMELDKMYRDAFNQEERGDLVAARNSYVELLDRSRTGYFQMLAEAGLYRTDTQRQKERTAGCRWP